MKRPIALLAGCLATVSIGLAQAEESAKPTFRPAYASSVKNVTADTLADEEYQVAFALEFQSAIDQLEVAKIRAEQAKTELDRNEVLVKGPNLSKRDYVISKDKYECAKFEVARLTAQVDFTKAMATVYRLRTTRAPEPTRDDLRAEITMRLEASQAKLASLNAALGSAQVLNSSLSAKATNGKKLLDLKTASTAEYELRLFNARASAESVEGLKAQIKIIEGTIESLQDSLKRI